MLERCICVALLSKATASGLTGLGHRTNQTRLRSYFFISSLVGVPQADAMEHALIAALPLGPQSAAGGVSLPDSFIVSFGLATALPA